jgi:hypothetical protein
MTQLNKFLFVIALSLIFSSYDVLASKPEAAEAPPATFEGEGEGEGAGTVVSEPKTKKRTRNIGTRDRGSRNKNRKNRKKRKKSISEKKERKETTAVMSGEAGDGEASAGASLSVATPTSPASYSVSSSRLSSFSASSSFSSSSSSSSSLSSSSSSSTATSSSFSSSFSSSSSSSFSAGSSSPSHSSASLSLSSPLDASDSFSSELYLSVSSCSSSSDQFSDEESSSKFDEKKAPYGSLEEKDSTRRHIQSLLTTAEHAHLYSQHPDLKKRYRNLEPTIIHEVINEAFQRFGNLRVATNLGHRWEHIVVQIESMDSFAAIYALGRDADEQKEIVNARTLRSGRTPLMMVAKRGSIEFFSHFTETYKPNPNLVSLFGQTALHELLNAQISDDKRPLEQIAAERYQKAIWLLGYMSAAAKRQEDIYGKTALDYVPSTAEFRKLREYLKANGVLRSAHPGPRKSLVEQDARDAELNTFLKEEFTQSGFYKGFRADEGELLSIDEHYRLLTTLESGANINACSEKMVVGGRRRQLNLLMLSIFSAQSIFEQSLRIALEYQADLNASIKAGDPKPLELAQERPLVKEVLLKAGAKPLA